ncbi:MAG: gamma-glutamylcyclotransferase [Methylococcaceae bacterium]|nr:gamma-glutamylcyclotransferase [Methylococcaceae bacterium]
MELTESAIVEHRVAVYGSLKGGRYNHRYLSAATLIGRFHTAPEYTMINLGAYPAIIPDGSTAIEVEVYAVDSDTLRALDKLEEHPHCYRRTSVNIASMDVFIYILTNRETRGIKNVKRRIIESGSW